MSLYEENILDDEKAMERFWAKVEVVDPNDPDACVLWNAKLDKNSCGIFCMHCPQLAGNKYTWKSFRAPRIRWIIENDRPIPDGLLVIHSCDNERCLNYRHLRLGTYKDNADDRRLRGRFDTGPKGEKHPNAVLTAAKVRKICHLYFVRGKTAQEISNKFGVTRAVIHAIVVGKAWKHVTKTHIPKGFVHKFEKCKLRNVKMYKAFKDGWTYQKIANHFNVNYKYTLEIVRDQRAINGDKPTPIGFKSGDRRNYK